MLSLHTNYAALSAQNSTASTNAALSTSMTRLGTGLRINSSMDDAAGLQIATRMEAATRGMTVAMRNTQNGISMMQVADGAMDEVTNILYRMKDLATESATDSTGTLDRASMQSEYDALGSELANIMMNTKFAGETLFGDTTAIAGVTGKFGTSSLKFQIGAAETETMTFDISASGTTKLSTLTAALTTVSSFYATTAPAAADTKIATQAAASGIISDLETAINSVGTIRSMFGATSNRLDHVANNLSNMRTNTEAAKGRIMDVDYATETANMTKQQLLVQAGTSMLKQSNSMSQLVLSLMQ